MTAAQPTPQKFSESAEYWRAANEGRLLVKQCTSCGKVHFYPRSVCPHCTSTETTWVEASGRGTVYTYSTMKQKDAQWTLAYVRLEEGVTMMTNIVDVEPSAIHVGMPVRVVFRALGGNEEQKVPVFTSA